MASLAIAHAAPIGKNCRPAPSAVSFKASTFASSTTSTTFVGIPETNVSFTQGAAGCVIVIFSGVSGNGTSLMYVQAVIGGVTGIPDGNRWSGGDDANGVIWRMHTGTYVFPDIPPGAHTAMQATFTGGVCN